MVRLVYISRSVVRPIDLCGAFGDILNRGQRRNAGLGLTGALVASRDWFAQVLEGPGQAVDQVMAAIVRDPRHEHVRVVGHQRVQRRQFRTALAPAYMGDAGHVQSRLDACLMRPGCPEAPRLLVRMMEDMARANLAMAG